MLKAQTFLKWFSRKLFYVVFVLNNRCTRVENPGEGVAQIFAKIPGGQGLPNKIAGVPFLGFIVFLLTIFF